MKKSLILMVAFALLTFQACGDDGSSMTVNSGSSTCNESEKTDASCTCNEDTGEWEDCESKTVKCNKSEKPEASCTCNEKTGKWENCGSKSKKCDESAKTNESCTCNKDTGEWENCGGENAKCNESEKTDESCTCNEDTGEWDCGSDQPKTCNESEKTDESCTCDEETGSWNCDSDQPKTCDESEKTDESCTCNKDTGEWENCGSEPPVVLEGCADPANEGKSCNNGESHACATAVCQGGNCVSVAVKDGRVCRKSAGACDVEEKCDGSSLDCPADKKQAKGFVCRASSGGCDAEEKCDGSSDKCPSDEFNSSCTCPSGSGAKSGVVTKISKNSFVLKDSNTWEKYQKAIDALGLKKYAVSELDFNRSMDSMGSKGWVGFKKGWFWNKGDREVSYWVPQGLAGCKHNDVVIRMVGWHYTDDKKVRISVVNTTDTSKTLKYRHALLVEPDDEKGFKHIQNHAGGLAIDWPYLYEAHTSKGVRVFDLRMFLKVDTSSDCDKRLGKYGSKYCGEGYAYVLPQVGGYYFPSGLHSSCRPKFSFIGLENVNGKKSILSGEYVKYTSSNSAIDGRLVRWPLGDDGKMATDANRIVKSSAAWYAGSPNLQGGVTYTKGSKTYFLLNSTRNSGTLYVGAEGSKTKAYTNWGIMPEGIYLTASDNVWVSTEGNGSLARSLYYAGISSFIK